MSSTTVQAPATFQALREKLLDQTTLVCFLLSFIIVPVSLFRYFQIGWQPAFTVHFLLACYLLILVLTRNHMSYTLKAIALLGLPGSVAAVAFLNLGVTGAGFGWTLCLILTGLIFFNHKIAFALAGVSFAAVLAAGYVHIHGIVDTLQTQMTVLTSWSHWLTTAVGIVTISGLLSVGFSRIMNYLKSTMESVQQDYNELLHDLPGSVVVLDWSRLKPRLESLVSEGKGDMASLLERDPTLLAQLTALQTASYGNRAALRLINGAGNNLTDIEHFYQNLPAETHPLRFASELLQQRRCSFRSVVSRPHLPPLTIEWTYRIPRTNQDDWSRIIVVGIDVTVRHEQEQRLETQHAEMKQLSSRLHALIESSSAPIVSVDLKGCITQWNSAMSSLTRLAANDTLGQHFSALISRISRTHDLFEKAVSDLFYGQPVQNFDLDIQAKNGALHILDSQLSPITDEHNSVTGVVAVFKDVTEERAAVRQQKRLSSALDQLDQGVALFDKNDCLRWYNSTWAEMNDMVSNHIKIGMPFEALLRHLIAAGGIPIANDDVEGWIRRRLALRKEKNVAFEVARDGKRLLVRDQQLAGGSLITTVIDITEVTNLRAQVVQSEKLASLGEMATGIAHELNQPLSIIRMSADNCLRKAKKGILDDTTLVAKLTKITDSVTRAATITNHMREFGRDSTLTLAPTNVREAVSNTLNMCEHQLRLAAIEIDLRLPATLPLANADLIRLEQVLINLVTNARQAMERNDNSPHKLSIYAENNTQALKLYVEDNGPGIPQDNLDTIFDPFFTTKEAGEGTGLGLSISYGLIKEMGGELTAGNTPQGARFEITLPLAEAKTVEPA